MNFHFQFSIFIFEFSIFVFEFWLLILNSKTRFAAFRTCSNG